VLPTVQAQENLDQSETHRAHAEEHGTSHYFTSPMIPLIPRSDTNAVTNLRQRTPPPHHHLCKTKRELLPYTQRQVKVTSQLSEQE
jgi:hypothetical protein